MIVNKFNIAGRKFLQIGRHCIPVDRIKEINLDAPNGGCDNAVSITVEGEAEKYVWAYDNADAVRAYLGVERDREGE